jgi:hypothetical protein
VTKRIPHSVSDSVLMLRCLCLAFVFLTAGCWSNYWGRRPLDQPTPVKPHAAVWIWSGDEVKKWHAVVITQDSVLGIPYQMSVRCDSCRRSIPRVQVDSMKLGYRTLVEGVTDVVALTVLGLGVEAAVCTLVAPRDRRC